MKIYNSIVVFFVFFSLNVSAQFITEWEKTFGGSGMDVAKSIVETKDKKLIIAGETSSKGAGSLDVNIMKLSLNGVVIWEKIYGGTNEDAANSIICTKDNGYAICGYTRSKGNGKYDIWVLKLDSKGELLWDKTFGDAGWDIAYSMAETADGNIIVAGCTETDTSKLDFVVLKLSAEGNLIWKKSYGGAEMDKAQSIIISNENEIVVAGYTMSKGNGKRDMWVIKLDQTGNKIWDTTIGGQNHENARSIIQTKDNGYAIAGYTKSNETGKSNIAIVKLNSQGKKQWQKNYGENNTDIAFDIIERENQNLIVTGYSEQSTNGKDCKIIRLDNYGNKLDDQIIGAKGDDIIHSVIKTFDNKLVLAGTTTSHGAVEHDIMLTKLNTNAISGKPPIITWLSPTNFTTEQVTIRTKISTNVKISVNKNKFSNLSTGNPAMNEGENIYQFIIKLRPGKNVIHLTASNNVGTTTKDITVNYTTKAVKPTIEWLYPPENLKTSRSTIKVKAQVLSSEEPWVTASKGKGSENIKIKSTSSDKDGVYKYSFTVFLKKGKNEISLTAVNSGGEAKQIMIITKE